MSDDERINPLFEFNLNEVTGNNRFDGVQVNREFNLDTGDCTRTRMALLSRSFSGSIILGFSRAEIETHVPVHILFNLGWLPEDITSYHEVEDNTLHLTQRFVPRSDFNPDSLWKLSLRGLGYDVMEILSESGLKLISSFYNPFPYFSFKDISGGFLIGTVASTIEELDFVTFEVKIPLEDVLKIEEVKL